jgi:VWFA-related protein
MSAWRPQVSALMLIITFLTVARAQEMEVIKVGIDLVTINIAVADRDKHPVTGLKARDFRVIEEGLPVDLEFCDAEGPATIVFVIDTSSSMANEKWKKLRAGLKEFLTKAREDNDYSLVVFSDTPRLVLQSATADELWRSFARLQPSGDTALYDGVLMGLETLRMARHRYRTLVLLSDGQDNCSHSDLQNVKREAATRRATIYTVGIRPDRLNNYLLDFEMEGKEILAQLAASTGGLSSFPNPNEIPKALKRIHADVNSQYTLGYYAHEKSPGWRSIHVSVVSNERRLNLRYQEQYLRR